MNNLFDCKMFSFINISICSWIVEWSHFLGKFWTINFENKKVLLCACKYFKKIEFAFTEKENGTFQSEYLSWKQKEPEKKINANELEPLQLCNEN